MFIGNIQAAKEGITLAAADIACFVEIPFVPGDLEQAQQRIWLPQKSNPLSYIYFVAKGTVDGKRIKGLLTRNKLISTILDGKPLLLFGGTLLEEICK
jgi:SNF2 family DNA or RNA helicase